MSENLTVEEINLICVYDSPDRTRLIADIRGSLPHVLEPEVTEIMFAVIDKLERMTDNEYAGTSFYYADELDVAEN